VVWYSILQKALATEAPQRLQEFHNFALSFMELAAGWAGLSRTLPRRMSFQMTTVTDDIRPTVLRRVGSFSTVVTMSSLLRESKVWALSVGTSVSERRGPAGVGQNSKDFFRKLRFPRGVV
jgi:hypothetical protein